MSKYDRSVRPSGWAPLGVAVLILAAGLIVVVYGGGLGDSTALERFITLVAGVIGIATTVVGGVLVAWFIWPDHREHWAVRRWLGSDGFAGGYELFREMSLPITRRAARQIRPDLKQRGWHRIPATEAGLYLGRVRVGPWVQIDIYSRANDVVLVLAPPQTGKTAFLGARAHEAPGALICTSTKADLWRYTKAIRSERGPMHVFNPEGIGDLLSNLRWSPVPGCTDPSIAIERAGYLLMGASVGEGVTNRDFFEGNANVVLRSFLMAAALEKRSMAQVAAWVANPNDPTPLEILQDYTSRGLVPRSWPQALAQLTSTSADRTRDSIFMTLGLAMQFMANPEVAAITEVGEGEEFFDVERFLEEKGTLYILGAEKPHASVAPLLTAFTAYLFENAKQIAEANGGQLGPPLTMLLDEAALITPVPLDRWTSDGSGRNITLLISIQSMSQLYARWGERGGETIWNNANAKIIFGGLSNSTDLEKITTTIGARRERMKSRTRDRDRGTKSTTMSEQRAQVLPPEKLRQLPRWHTLILYRTMSATISKFTPVWKYRLYRAAERRARRAERDRIRAMSAPPVEHDPEEEAAAA